MRSFLKWAGGKHKILNRVLAALPKGRRLVEPFAGSAVVALNSGFDNLVIADANKDLINLYLEIKVDPLGFVEEATKLFVPETNTQEAFYRLREEFNTSQDIKRKSHLFVYLNRHCFNGLCRYNSKGGFNVPFGRYSSPQFPTLETLAFAKITSKASFLSADFRTTMLATETGDVVYCDPPYSPLSATANFSDYTEKGFGPQDQRDLAELAEQLAGKGIPVVISNHDTSFTRAAYAQASIEAFDVQRFISSNAANRGKASELLASFR